MFLNSFLIVAGVASSVHGGASAILHDPSILNQYEIVQEEEEETFQVLNELCIARVTEDAVWGRIEPDIKSDSSLVFTRGEELAVVSVQEEWCKVLYQNHFYYVKSQYLVSTGIALSEKRGKVRAGVLSKRSGRVLGPSGEETYYNLDMSGCVARMHRLGFEGEYWVRDDGVKMLGDNVMIAADFNTRPLGTILETSLGTGIVVDTGGFAEINPTQIDIAVNW